MATDHVNPTNPTGRRPGAREPTAPRSKAEQARIKELLATPLTDRRHGPVYGDIPQLAAWIEAHAHLLRFE